ncbi:MAG: 4Fe-4S binding protein [Sporomusaceae bacterium]|nr:4Fe-4S binding protein [Sporomusaceae bacterium]
MAGKTDYKKFGFIPQRQKGLLLMRVRNAAGDMTATQMRKLADLAEKYGNGEFHVTVRQGMEIPGVKEELFEEAYNAILEAGLLPAVCGPRVRPVVSCPGTATCPYGLEDTKELAKFLDQHFVGRELPAKTKFAISGCANACTKPEAHDVGCKGAHEPIVDPSNCIHCGACVRRCPAKAMSLDTGEVVIDTDKCLACGVCISICPKKTIHTGRTGFHVYIGGKGGRYSYDGKLLESFVPADKIAQYLDALLAVYNEKGEKGQRLCVLVANEGIEALTAQVQEKFKQQQQ